MMSNSAYTSPSLVGLDTKKAQLESLQVVQEGATFQFKKLSDEDERIDERLKLFLWSSGRNPQSNFTGSYETDVTSIQNSNMSRLHSSEGHGHQDGYGNMHQYRSQPSLADSTLTSEFNRQVDYTNYRPQGHNGNSNIEIQSHGDVNQYHQQPSLVEGVLQEHNGRSGIPTKKNNATGLDHPYDAEYNFTSRFPVGFRGCFICGEMDHFSKMDCKKGINTKEEILLFFNEMWAHKPHTKKRSRDGAPVRILVHLQL